MSDIRGGHDPRQEYRVEKITSKEIKTIEYPERMTAELIDQWAEGIPLYSEADPKNPEWRSTPVRTIDLSSQGYGEVHIKMESDKRSNPTGTMKDRPAWEFACGYRDFARRLSLKMTRDKRISPSDVKIPRFSLITAGNEGLAIARACQKYNLPPPKILMDHHTSQEALSFLTNEYAEIYTGDLSIKALTHQEINTLTKNKNGVDLTSLILNDRNAVFYDWHVHEAFNEKPAIIFMPYGSGRLMDGYSYWQHRTGQNAVRGTRDPRLRIDPLRVADMSIVGVEPAKMDRTIADKAAAPFKPFLLLNDNDRAYLREQHLSGRFTGTKLALEEEIEEAFEYFLNHDIEAEPTGAIGLAMYLRFFRDKLIDHREKILVINTGRGELYEATHVKEKRVYEHK